MIAAFKSDPLGYRHGILAEAALMLRVDTVDQRELRGDGRRRAGSVVPQGCRLIRSTIVCAAGRCPGRYHVTA